jgi:hypothetical protein
MTETTRVNAATVLLAGIGALLGMQPGLAQRGSEVTVEVSDCLKIEAPAERLACFERRVEETRGEGAVTRPSPGAAATRPAPPAPAASAPPPPAPAARTVPAEAAPPAPAARAPVPPNDDSFGRPDSSRREQRAARERAEDERQEERTELVAKVVSLRETIPNNYVITLDNGQVWRQNRPEAYPLQPGLEVRIYPGRMGDSYRLTAPFLRGWIQVERVR